MVRMRAVANVWPWPSVKQHCDERSAVQQAVRLKCMI